MFLGSHPIAIAATLLIAAAAVGGIIYLVSSSSRDRAWEDDYAPNISAPHVPCDPSQPTHISVTTPLLVPRSPQPTTDVAAMIQPPSRQLPKAS